MNKSSYSIEEVTQNRQASGDSWYEFLKTQTLSMGVYHVDAGTTDKDSHTPHDRDEIYICSEGRGRLTADKEVFDMKPGQIVFVKAGIEHNFHDVESDLTLIVFFAG